MWINIIGLSMILLAVPFLVGMLYSGAQPEGKGTALLSWAAGYIVLWGFFEMVALPLIFQRKSLDFLCVAYSGLVILLMLAALFRSRNKIAPLVKASVSSIRNRSLVGWANVLLILGQAFVYVRYLHIDEDDAFYVGAASTAVSTNTIFSVNPYTGVEYATLPARYVLSPFFSFVAYLSRISGVHPAVAAHLVLAGILIALSYGIYALIGKKLFPDNPRQSDCFLFFVILLTLFSGYTVYTQGMFALVRIWQGKAVFCAILAPMICYMMLHLSEGKAAAADWQLTFLLMCACCMVSSMGIMLGAVMAGIFGILNVLKNRDIKGFIYTILCCIPNMVCAVLHLMLR